MEAATNAFFLCSTIIKGCTSVHAARIKQARAALSIAEKDKVFA
jgi:hypothetical protein